MTSIQDIKTQQAMGIIGYQFIDTNYLWEALQVAGSGVQTFAGRSVPKGNQRLAIHGDSTLQYAKSKNWYSTNNTLGEWSHERQLSPV